MMIMGIVELLIIGVVIAGIVAAVVRRLPSAVRAAIVTLASSEPVFLKAVAQPPESRSIRVRA